jgi:hypothetical protein
MKPRKKLEGNGLWESSRMRLPEHQARIQQSTRELEKREKPALDPQKREEIGERLSRAYREGAEIGLVLFGPYGNRTIRGVIAKADPLARKLLIGGAWIRVEDVVDIC